MVDVNDDMVDAALAAWFKEMPSIEEIEAIGGYQGASLVDMRRDMRAAIEAAISTLSARVAELERERDEAAKDCDLLIKWAASHGDEPDIIIVEMMNERARASALEAEVERLRESLIKTRHFINGACGIALGVAMSGKNHPNPDGVLMALSTEGTALSSAIAAALAKEGE